MPLNAASMTIASRVMLRAYPVFALGVGLSFALTPTERLILTPTLAFANTLVPIHAWGWGFVTVGLVLVVALVSQNRHAYSGALAVMFAWMLTYTGMSLWAALEGSGSFSAWLWPGIIAAACLASMLSIEARER